MGCRSKRTRGSRTGSCQKLTFSEVVGYGWRLPVSFILHRFDLQDKVIYKALALRLTGALAAVVVAATLISGCDDGGAYRGGVPNNKSTVSPAGTKVSGRTMPTAAAMAAIDRGLSETFEIARGKTYSYSLRLAHSDYWVGLAPTDPACNNPAFLIRYSGAAGNPYDQSPVDKDTRPGEIALCVAGKVERFSYPGQCLITIADHPDNWQIASRFEAEHCVLYANNITLFWATLYHVNSGHPIMSGSAFAGPKQFDKLAPETDKGHKISALVTE